jgi:hypothetical protein
MVGLVMPALIYHFELNSRSVGIFLVSCTVLRRSGYGWNSGESRYGTSQTLPYWGHGTGATRGLFAQSAVAQTGATAVGNPHNFAAAIWEALSVCWW